MKLAFQYVKYVYQISKLERKLNLVLCLIYIYSVKLYECFPSVESK